MMKIAAFPAFKSKKNPYQLLLYKHLKDIDNTVVDEFGAKNIIVNRYDIIHIHWPESNKLKRNVFVAFSYVIVFTLLILIAKLKGAKIIWTIHNIQPHEQKSKFLENLLYWMFTRLVDGFIVMNAQTTDKSIDKYPALKGKPHQVILHGHYKGSYPNIITVAEARSNLGLNAGDKVYLILGQIRPYKGVEGLIDAFKKVKDRSFKLIIAGSVDVEGPYFRKLNEMIAGDERVILIPEFIADDVLQNYINACDIVVLPYKYLLNSGALFLALSFNRPVLVPAQETVKDLVVEYGEQWIIGYDVLDEDALIFGMNTISNKQDNILDMADRNWDKIAMETFNFFKG
jgi:glycosyltransferase involved in cell wall biosynthesis